MFAGFLRLSQIRSLKFLAYELTDHVVDISSCLVNIADTMRRMVKSYNDLVYFHANIPPVLSQINDLYVVFKTAWLLPALQSDGLHTNLQMKCPAIPHEAIANRSRSQLSSWHIGRVYSAQCETAMRHDVDRDISCVGGIDESVPLSGSSYGSVSLVYAGSC